MRSLYTLYIISLRQNAVNTTSKGVFAKIFYLFLCYLLSFKSFVVLYTISLCFSFCKARFFKQYRIFHQKNSPTSIRGGASHMAIIFDFLIPSGNGSCKLRCCSYLLQAPLRRQSPPRIRCYWHFQSKQRHRQQFQGL